MSAPPITGAGRRRIFVAADWRTPIGAGRQTVAIALVAVAYAFVWIVLMAYVWSVGRRLQKVEREVAHLERGGG